MNIYVDVDNTITKTVGMDYENAEPVFKKISIINGLYDKGHTITYWTARGSVSGINYYDLTKKQLDEWVILILDKKNKDIQMGKHNSFVTE